MFTSISLVLGIILEISLSVLIVRKVLMGSKGTESGILNLILIISSLIGLFCTLIVFYDIRFMTTSTIPMVNLPQELAETKTNIVISFIIGYTSLFLDYILCKLIERNNQKQIKHKRHWDLNKFQ